ncbi:FUSC family protein [Glycomyces terrestris]|nr:FUSC family protein [Glycomyces terrestris]
MTRHPIREGVGRDLRGAWGFARAVPRRGSWARETAIQALKAGMAAVLAWFVAAHLLHLPQPYLAPWAALCMVRPTVRWSVLTGLRQVAAVALGVVVAVAATALMPGKELALAVCVPVAFLVSYWPRLDDQGQYVPFTALFMIAVDSVEEPFVLFRLVETALGAAIGMGVNLLVAPPIRVLTVDARARRDADGAAGLMRELAGRLRAGEADAGDESWSARVRRLEEHLSGTEGALQHARDGLRLNPRRSEAGIRNAVERAGRALEVNRRVVRAARALAEVLDDVRRDDTPDPSLDPGFRRDCAEMLETAADACERRVAALLGPEDEAEGPDLSAALDALEHRVDPTGGDLPTTEAQSALVMAVRRLVLAVGSG